VFRELRESSDRLIMLQTFLNEESNLNLLFFRSFMINRKYLINTLGALEGGGGGGGGF